MKKTAFIAISVFLLSIQAIAQHAKPYINFKEKIHDFGEFNESEGLKTYVFNFTNTGGQPLILHKVNASCGCTTPTYTKKPIPPGGSGNIKVVFNPKNRPGNFNKTITVSSNAENASVILRITGKVIPRELTLNDKYPANMEGIRLESTHIAFTRMTPDQKKTEQLKIINTTDAPVKIGFVNVPKHLSIKCFPETLKPGEKGVISATYNAKLKNDWGFVVDNLFITLNDKRNYKNRLAVSANIVEDFDSWSEEQMKNAPKIEIPEKVFNFGEIKQGEKVEHKFKVTNAGKSPLIFRKIKASCGCTAIKPQKMELAPGESTYITAIFNSAHKKGRQNKSITIISNDPKNTTVLLRISGNVTLE
ncbi:MAG: DUF1573 domain-containing protein [Chlorobi bacterium]|nr:DUF1573 domain-containing protein [Chlorobiota bacterium]